MSESDAVYIVSPPMMHFDHSKRSLEAGKHVLCESPIAFSKQECNELFDIATSKNLVMMESIKTAYSTAYNRLLLLVKSGKLGKIYSVETTCTSLMDLNNTTELDFARLWSSICGWGPTAMLPIFQILGTEYFKKTITTAIVDPLTRFDAFTKIDFHYSGAVGTVKVGKGVKSEGEMVIAGSKGYIYVPAPWWKTDYFEIRYENPADNKRYFYQLDGEGIRYEWVAFVKSIEVLQDDFYISKEQSRAIAEVIGDYYTGRDVDEIQY